MSSSFLSLSRRSCRHGVGMTMLNSDRCCYWNLKCPFALGSYRAAGSQAALQPRIVLGIETSCDDTGAAVMDEAGRILGESLHSQKEVHLK